MYKYSLRETELIAALPYTFHASKRLKYHQSLQSARRFNGVSPDAATSAAVDVRHRIPVIFACVSMTYQLCLSLATLWYVVSQHLHLYARNGVYSRFVWV